MIYLSFYMILGFQSTLITKYLLTCCSGTLSFGCVLLWIDQFETIIKRNVMVISIDVFVVHFMYVIVNLKALLEDRTKL